MNKIVLTILLLFLFISTAAQAEPTDAEFDQAVQSALTRIKGDRSLLEIVVSLPAELRRDFVADVALVELLAMERLKNGEPQHGKEPSF